MAKSFKKRLVEWNDSYYIFRDLEVKECKDFVGSKYSVWSTTIGDGAIQIEVRGYSASLWVVRNLDDWRDDSKIYQTEDYKVFDALLELLYTLLYDCQEKYDYFSDLADSLEKILSMTSMELFKVYKPKK